MLSISYKTNNCNIVVSPHVQQQKFARQHWLQKLVDSLQIEMTHQVVTIVGRTKAKNLHNGWQFGASLCLSLERFEWSCFYASFTLQLLKMAALEKDFVGQRAVDTINMIRNIKTHIKKHCHIVAITPKCKYYLVVVVVVVKASNSHCKPCWISFMVFQYCMYLSNAFSTKIQGRFVVFKAINQGDNTIIMPLMNSSSSDFPYSTFTAPVVGAILHIYIFPILMKDDLN